MALFKDDIVEALGALEPSAAIFERSEGRVGDEEGLDPAIGVLRGDAPPEAIIVEENGYKFLVDIRRGQKTGFFLDQRDNRAFLSTLARDRSVLNCFSFSGAFSVYAFAGKAKEVVTLDSSKPALELAEQNLSVERLRRGARRAAQRRRLRLSKRNRTKVRLDRVGPAVFGS